MRPHISWDMYKGKKSTKSFNQERRPLMKDTELSLLNARKEFDGLLELIETAIWQGQELHKVEAICSELCCDWVGICFVIFLPAKVLGIVALRFCTTGRYWCVGKLRSVPTGRSLGT